jgi:hypothetical protein
MWHFPRRGAELGIAWLVAHIVRWHMQVSIAAERIISIFSIGPRLSSRAQADCYLIAHALAHGFTVVTFEKRAGPNSSKIKIPDVCAALNVKCIDLWALIQIHPVIF